jgi:hypothetical protein
MAGANLDITIATPIKNADLFLQDLWWTLKVCSVKKTDTLLMKELFISGSKVLNLKMVKVVGLTL